MRPPGILLPEAQAPSWRAGREDALLPATAEILREDCLGTLAAIHVRSLPKQARVREQGGTGADLFTPRVLNTASRGGRGRTADLWTGPRSVDAARTSDMSLTTRQAIPGVTGT